MRGELCTGYAARVGVLGEFCTGYAARAGVQGEFCTGSVPCSSCWESFVPKGPGVVVVRRIMSCSGVVLVPVAGRSALAPLMGSAAESSVSWRSPRRRWGFCTTRSPLTECRRRVEPSCSAIPPDWWRRGRPKTVDVQQGPPGLGQGVTTSSNQAFCSAPCAANMRITMIELLSAWNSHE